MVGIEFLFFRVHVGVMERCPNGLFLRVMRRVWLSMDLRVVPGFFLIPLLVLAGIRSFMELGIILLPVRSES